MVPLNSENILMFYHQYETDGLGKRWGSIRKYRFKFIKKVEIDSAALAT